MPSVRPEMRDMHSQVREKCDICRRTIEDVGGPRGPSENASDWLQHGSISLRELIVKRPTGHPLSHIIYKAFSVVGMLDIQDDIERLEQR